MTEKEAILKLIKIVDNILYYTEMGWVNIGEFQKELYDISEALKKGS